jgi:benzoylformate decarboxylase
MAQTTGKQAFLEILKQEGVGIIFGNPGTTELPLMDALVQEPSIRYVLALHESVAIAMADGFATASGDLAVANVHIAPGLGNALGMLYNAQKSGAPLLLTAGQHDQSFTATEPVVWADLPPLAKPFVKWSGEVRRAEDLPRLLRRATKTALSHPRGPVFLSLPVDVLNAERDFDLLSPTRIASGTVADRSGIDQAGRLLAKAKSPLIVAGDAVALSDSLAELVELAELVGCPVVNECMASMCAFPFTHPQYAGSMSRLAPQIRALLNRHDLLFSVGADLFTLSLPDEVDPLPRGLTVVHLDQDPWELGKNYPAAVALQGDPKATLPELTEALRRHTTRQGHADAAQRRAVAGDTHERVLKELNDRASKHSAQTPISPLTLVRAIAANIPPDTTIVEEVLSSVEGIRWFFPCADSKALFGMRGGGIGWGLPAAMGVKLALPSRRVVALLGDGSAMYTIQALWTAARQSIAVVFIIFNNACYRILKQRVLSLKGFSACNNTFVGMDLDRPSIDHVGLARSFGVAGEQVIKVTDIGAALQRGFASGGPYLIDARISSI